MPILQLPLIWERDTELMASNSNTPAKTLMLHHPHAAPSLPAQAPFQKTPHTTYQLTHHPSAASRPLVHPVACANTSNSSGGVGAGGGAYYNNPRSAKEMEALGIRGGVHVMNPSHDGEYSQHAQGLGQGMYAGGWGKQRVRRTLLEDLLLRTLLVQVGGPSRSLFIGMWGGCLLLGGRRRNMWLRRRFRLLMIFCRRRRGCSVEGLWEVVSLVFVVEIWRWKE